MPLHELLDVELRRVTKRFGSMVAVNEVSVTIPKGAFFSLLGPSGCGKTTTLRLIAGFEEPSVGEVLIGGTSMGLRPPYLRPVNTVFQSYALFPHLNVFENVAFGLRRKQVASDEIRSRVFQSLELVNLKGLDKRRMAQLSGGQQQRVALARALVNRPSVLLLDEPLAALDPKLRKTMQSELKRLQREVGITFVLVTHDQEEALTMSDLIAVMNGGCLEQVGTPQQVYETPQTRFVADFIGLANFLPGEVMGVDAGRTTVRLRGGDLVTVVESSGALAGSPVELVLRPETLELEGHHANSVKGTVVDCVYLGSQVHYHVRLKCGTELMVIGRAGGQATGDCVVGWPAEVGRLLPAALVDRNRSADVVAHQL